MILPFYSNLVMLHHLHYKLDTTGSCTRYKSWDFFAFRNAVSRKKMDSAVVHKYKLYSVQLQQENQNIATQYRASEFFLLNTCLVGASNYCFWVNPLQETKKGKFYPLII